MSSVKALLCYQNSGSGALTRICEMLIAGVPVIANSHAARSFYNKKGLIEFSVLEDIDSVLIDLKNQNYEMPEIIKKSANSLIAYLEGIN